MEIAQKYHLSVEQLRDEFHLVEAAKADAKNFKPLYEKHYEAVFRFLYQRLDDKDQAFDLCSQVFLKAMTKLDQYTFRGLPFSAWLFRIARNELNQLFRHNSSLRTVNVDTEGLSIMMEEMEEDHLEKYRNRMIDAVARLDEGSLQLIEMRYFEKRAFKEIAEILDITENNAKVKLYRTLDKLKKEILKKK
jgi:RNA polymerase sigma-70 factor (ECF subfamily)